jgi:hypothetical protein
MSTKLQTLRNLIASSQGRFFTATFIRKDGTVRVMNARLGVRSSSGSQPTTAGFEHYLTVYDVKKNGYRTINLNTVSEVKVNGVTFKVQ